jgi:uncharacterized protein YmfQ (DUF2313 family)
MDVRTLVDHIQSRGFSLRLVGNKVRIEGPEPDPSISAIIEKLRRHKEEVRAVVEAQNEVDQPETIAVSLLVENDSDEAEQILDAWQRLFGITLDRHVVTDHLKRLRRWERRV